MSPVPPEDPITLPRWIMRFVVVPVGVGVATLMWWLGRQMIDAWDDERQELQERVQELEGEVRSLKEQIRYDHSGVASKVQHLDAKMDEVLEEVS